MSLFKADVDYFIVDKVSRLDGMNNGTAITSHYRRESLLHQQLVAYQVITGWHLNINQANEVICHQWPQRYEVLGWCNMNKQCII